jgi:hypothetical protein
LLRTSKFPQKKLNYASNYYGQNCIKKFYLILLIISGTEFIFSGDRHWLRREIYIKLQHTVAPVYKEPVYIFLNLSLVYILMLSTGCIKS